MCCGDFCLISSYVFTTLFFLLFSFVSIFIFKEDNMFYIHFQRGSPQQWIRAKGSSKSFLTKAPTPPWHHWEQSTHFFHFFGFLYFHYIRRLHFYHFIRFTIFLYFYIVFFFLAWLCFKSIIITRREGRPALILLSTALQQLQRKVTIGPCSSAPLLLLTWLKIFTMNQKNQMLFQKQNDNSPKLRQKTPAMRSPTVWNQFIVLFCAVVLMRLQI